MGQRHARESTEGGALRSCATQVSPLSPLEAHTAGRRGTRSICSLRESGTVFCIQSNHLQSQGYGPHVLQGVWLLRTVWTSSFTSWRLFEYRAGRLSRQASTNTDAHLV